MPSGFGFVSSSSSVTQPGQFFSVFCLTVILFRGAKMFAGMDVLRLCFVCVFLVSFHPSVLTSGKSHRFVMWRMLNRNLLLCTNKCSTYFFNMPTLRCVYKTSKEKTVFRSVFTSKQESRWLVETYDHWRTGILLKICWQMCDKMFEAVVLLPNYGL